MFNMDRRYMAMRMVAGVAALGIVSISLSACEKKNESHERSSSAASSTELSTSGSSSDLSTAGRSASNASGNLCDANALGVVRDSGEGAAGSIYEVIKVTNNGSEACDVKGAPGIQRVSQTDGVMIAPNVEPTATGNAITLQPDRAAYFTLGLSNLAPDGSPYEPAKCKAVALKGINIYLSGSKDALFLPQKGYGCSTGIDKLEVQPFSAHRQG